MKISVVIPAYNEEKRIDKTLSVITGYFKANKIENEIIIVDDGSTDNTVSVVKQHIISNPDIRLLLNNKNCGKGYSVRNGVLNSTGDPVLFMDADLSTPIEELEKLKPYFQQGYDIVFGSRGLKESEIKIKQKWLRQNMGKTFNKLLQFILVPGINDTQCGFKLFTRNSINLVFPYLLLNGFSFDAELAFIAVKRGLKIREVPVQWINSFDSKVHIIKDSLLMFMDLFRIRLNFLLNKYELKK